MRPFGYDGGGDMASTGRGIERRQKQIRRLGRDALLAEIFFPEIREWRPVLDRLALPLEAALAAAIHARDNGCDFQSALSAQGLVSQGALLKAIADALGLGVVEAIDPQRIVLTEKHAITLLRGRDGKIPVKLLSRDGDVVFLITPERLKLDAMRKRLAARPALARHLRLVDRKVLRAALIERARPLLAREATLRLAERFPALSARTVVNAWQASAIGAAVALLPVGLFLAAGSLLAVAHVLATVFFFACAGLRLTALAAMWRRKPPAAAFVPEGEKPVYSVLVALYREAAVVPDLIARLDRLVWPRDRLDIKLVCEEGDTGTLAVISARDLPPHIEVVEVPKGGPKTKPKALAYALQMAGGEFVALYDAEDEPHPMQLIEAWHRFRNAGPDLAAVQAPLEIPDRQSGFIARMFAFEYAAQFRGLLPWLSDQGLMLPLGGTSNHFRRAALEAAGGWDPFNVTEDADLGIRLARLGYRAEVISCPTREQPPRNFSVWLPQRSRWFKGWAQTWLVHMRNPALLARELGFGSFLIAQVLFAGMLASALLHPLLLATLIYCGVGFLLARPAAASGSLLLGVDVANVVVGYASFLLLGRQTLARRERRAFWKTVLCTPFYWVMLSAAGWRALWQLYRRPHHWEKTPHEPDRRCRGPSGI